MTRILLTGATGQVGWELLRTLAPLGEVIAPARNKFDLAQPKTLRKKIRDLRPDIIVNPAAYTAVDKAEQESNLAFVINAESPSVLAEEADRLNIPLVHFSTDYVFDGKNTLPYNEEDTPNPLNVYGESKLKGEELVHQMCEQHIIFRTSWIYDLRSHNFLTTMRRLFREHDEVEIVNDQKGAPTWSRMIAEATVIIIGKLLTNSNSIKANQGIWGLYHLTASGETNWHEFAKKILEKEQLEKPPNLKCILTSDYPTPAKRPMYSVLDNTRIFNKHGIKLPSWQESLETIIF